MCRRSILRTGWTPKSRKPLKMPLNFTDQQAMKLWNSPLRRQNMSCLPIKSLSSLKHSQILRALMESGMGFAQKPPATRSIYISRHAASGLRKKLSAESCLEPTV
jgi:hypothetical protein